MRETNTASMNKSADISSLLWYQITGSLFDCPVPFEAISSDCDLSLIRCLSIHNAIKTGQTANKKLSCVYSVTRPASISVTQTDQVTNR